MDNVEAETNLKRGNYVSRVLEEDLSLKASCNTVQRTLNHYVLNA